MMAGRIPPSVRPKKKRSAQSPSLLTTTPWSVATTPQIVTSTGKNLVKCQVKGRHLDQDTLLVCSYFLDQEIRGYLGENIRHVQDRQCDSIIVVIQFEIFRQAINLGVSYISPIQKRQQVKQDHHGHNMKVNLAQQSSRPGWAKLSWRSGTLVLFHRGIATELLFSLIRRSVAALRRVLDSCERHLAVTPGRHNGSNLKRGKRVGCRFAQRRSLN